MRKHFIIFYFQSWYVVVFLYIVSKNKLLEILNGWYETTFWSRWPLIETSQIRIDWVVRYIILVKWWVIFAVSFTWEMKLFFVVARTLMRPLLFCNACFKLFIIYQSFIIKTEKERIQIWHDTSKICIIKHLQFCYNLYHILQLSLMQHEEFT